MESNEMFRAAMLLMAGIGTIGGIFITLAGITIAEYIRRRRLTPLQRVEIRQAKKLAKRIIKTDSLYEVNKLLIEKESRA